MSIFRKKPKEEQPMSFMPQQDFMQEPSRNEVVIDGIQRAVDNIPAMFGGFPQQQIQPQASQPIVAQPQPKQFVQPTQQVQPVQQMQPSIAQPQSKLSDDAIIEAFNDHEERLAFLEKLVRRLA